MTCPAADTQISRRAPCFTMAWVTAAGPGWAAAVSRGPRSRPFLDGRASSEPAGLPGPSSPDPGHAGPRRRERSISRKLSTNTPTWNHSVRTTEAAKSRRSAAPPALASTGCAAAGSTWPAPGGTPPG